MKRTLVRYRTHADRADENQRLVEAVFAELEAGQPAGVRYAALRLPDATFYHLVMVEPGLEPSPIAQLRAFRAFQAGMRDRCVEAPQASDATIIGNFRMIGG